MADVNKLNISAVGVNLAATEFAEDPEFNSLG